MKKQSAPWGQVFCVCSMLVGVLPAGYAATCTVSAQGLNFGEYDLLNALDGIANITISCSRPLLQIGNVVYTIELSVGAGSYVAREMRSGASVLNYNLFTNATRSIVWGDGVSSGVVSGRINLPLFVLNGSANHPVYGRIPGNQSNVEPGVYASPVPITVTVRY